MHAADRLSMVKTREWDPATRGSRYPHKRRACGGHLLTWSQFTVETVETVHLDNSTELYSKRAEIRSRSCLGRPRAKGRLLIRFVFVRVCGGLAGLC